MLLRGRGAATNREDVGEAACYLEDIAARERGTLVAHDCQHTMLLLAGDPAEQIVQQAETECHLVIMATHGRTGLARWALGSVAHRVVQGATTPVLLVPAP